MFGKKKQYPSCDSFDSDADGHHYVPGRARGNADYFSRPTPPVRDAETGHPIGSNGRIDWIAVIDAVNKRDRGQG